VLEVGPGVTRFKPGDKVASCFFQRWAGGQAGPEAQASALGGGIDGMLAEQIVLEEYGAVELPAHLSIEEGATLPCAALTAWHALVEHARIQPGQTVLVQGDRRCIDLRAAARPSHERARDRHVVQRAKLERAKQLGAAHGINYKRTPDWDKAALELTAGVGVDPVVAAYKHLQSGAHVGKVAIRVS